MKSAYIMKEVRMRRESEKDDSLEFAIEEGDIILDKNFRFKVLPAAMDTTKPISRQKVTNAPEKRSERLLRIKKLGENHAVIAILTQESYLEGSDTLVTKENEKLITVNYGEEFYAYAKQQFTDMRGAITYSFIITDTSNPQKRNAQSFCTKCGVRLINGDKFCRECGTPILKLGFTALR